MKVTRISENTIWDHMRCPSSTPIALFSASKNRPLHRFMLWIVLFVSLTYLAYTLKLIFTPRACNPDDVFTSHTRHRRSSAIPYAAYPPNPSIKNQTLYNARPEESVPATHVKTGLEHIVFGIAASAKLWEQRKYYIKLWWKPGQMRGVVWLDGQTKAQREAGLPPVRISADTSRFAYTSRRGKRAAIRISRIVSETVRLGMENVRWLVMGDDDTFFVADNLVRVLSKYDHNQFYYIGSSSESHLQNIYFSYGMAYGGGGFAISYPLAKALEKMQDRCIQRYPGLYGSDERIHACMAELGVPLTRELGFHQYDVYGDLFGLLAAHPVTPLVSLHHLDVVEPIFPNLTRVQALQQLKVPMKLDSAGLMQQSICYEQSRKWTVSVSWGFAVQIFRGVLSPREVEMPSRTFLNWHKREDYRAYAFNTRPVSRNPCQKPFVFYISGFLMNQTVSEYARHHVAQPACGWKMADPGELDRVQVCKKPDPHLWDRSPRKNCCRILDTKRRSMVVHVGVCRQGEISEIV